MHMIYYTGKEDERNQLCKCSVFLAEWFLDCPGMHCVHGRRCLHRK